MKAAITPEVFPIELTADGMPFDNAYVGWCFFDGDLESELQNHEQHVGIVESHISLIATVVP